MKNSKILFVIPAYNEEENIKNTINKIENYNKKNKTKFDYIVINDGSRDRTESILCENKFNHIRLIKNLGIGGAVQTGYKYAYENDYDIAIQFDADGQHDIDSALNIIKPIMDGKANLVIGSRFVDKSKENFKSSGARRMGIKLISFFIKLKTGKKIFDTTSGYRAIDKSIIQKFANHYPLEYPEPISTVDVLREGYNVEEVYVKMHERQGGKSSIHTWKSVYYMINVILTILLMKKKVK